MKKKTKEKTIKKNNKGNQKSTTTTKATTTAKRMQSATPSGLSLVPTNQTKSPFSVSFQTMKFLTVITLITNFVLGIRRDEENI